MFTFLTIFCIDKHYNQTFLSLEESFTVAGSHHPLIHSVNSQHCYWLRSIC